MKHYLRFIRCTVAALLCLACLCAAGCRRPGVGEDSGASQDADSVSVPDRPDSSLPEDSSDLLTDDEFSDFIESQQSSQPDISVSIGTTTAAGQTTTTAAENGSTAHTTRNLWDRDGDGNIDFTVK